jgi:hypothetical protein
MFAREQERRVRKLSMKGWGLGEGVGRVGAPVGAVLQPQRV